MRIRLLLAITIVLTVISAHAQEYNKFLFNVGGGVGFPDAPRSSNKDPSRDPARSRGRTKRAWCGNNWQSRHRACTPKITITT